MGSEGEHIIPLGYFASPDLHSTALTSSIHASLSCTPPLLRCISLSFGMVAVVRCGLGCGGWEEKQQHWDWARQIKIKKIIIIKRKSSASIICRSR